MLWIQKREGRGGGSGGGGGGGTVIKRKADTAERNRMTWPDDVVGRGLLHSSRN